MDHKFNDGNIEKITVSLYNPGAGCLSSGLPFSNWNEVFAKMDDNEKSHRIIASSLLNLFDGWSRASKIFLYTQKSESIPEVYWCKTVDEDDFKKCYLNRPKLADLSINFISK